MPKIKTPQPGTDIRPMNAEADDAPIGGHLLNFGGRRISFKEPVLVFQPVARKKHAALSLDVPAPLDIHLVASNRRELLDDLSSEILFLWDEYACANEETLELRARKLKEFLLDHIEERSA